MHLPNQEYTGIINILVIFAHFLQHRCYIYRIIYIHTHAHAHVYVYDIVKLFDRYFLVLYFIMESPSSIKVHSWIADIIKVNVKVGEKS